ncbi:hypothetical protein N0V90_002872 [Kalmusia sp. IMI 367209]|nr:hypothetical protein N0V90_002872 [Kalmusia sp. IMI 367209]
MSGNTSSRRFGLRKPSIEYKAHQGTEGGRQIPRSREERSNRPDNYETRLLLGKLLYKEKKFSEAKEAFRQAVRTHEEISGSDSGCTLRSKLWLGKSLCKEHDNEAIEVLRQVVRGLEDEYGPSHSLTIVAKYWLAKALVGGQDYSEAVEVLRQVVRDEEDEHGPNHPNTAMTNFWLGKALYAMEKYSEAEDIFRQALHGYKKKFGPDHRKKFEVAYWLGLTLYSQKKDSEAEETFHRAVYDFERIFGPDNHFTISSKYWLGITLFQQMQHSKAEEIFRHTLYKYEQDKQYYEHAIETKYWLGRSLYEQHQHSSAEEVLRQAVRAGDETFGPDHLKTLKIKHWLGVLLYEEKNYREAEDLLGRALRGREEQLGKDDEETLETMRMLQKLLLRSSLPSHTNATLQGALATQLSSFLQDGQDHRESYTDFEIAEISRLLKQAYPLWGKFPRTYIVLRKIGHTDLLDDFIDAGFSDYWFPVTERNLPGCLQPSARSAFVNAQNLVLTQSLDLERGENGQHCYFKQGDPLPFDTKSILGSGAFGQVDRILSQISFREYARKRVSRVIFRGRSKDVIKQFIAEIEILKRLKHDHIVKFVGSYTDPKSIGLIMSPVADENLSEYLARTKASNYRELRTFFGCLARALEYLHEQRIRHKDIKPNNILVHNGNVLFVDFGLSLDFTDADGSTSISMVNGMTPRYCAPEVALQEPRNTTSDIWSLGIVFMEMIVVLKGKTTQYMDEFFEQHGTRQVYIRSNMATLSEFMAELERIGMASDNRALSWAQQMLSAEQRLRPTATSLVTSITTLGKHGEGTGFCGICCMSPEEDFSDWTDE